MSRFTRQADLVPLDQLQSLTVTVIGVGAVGRQVAVQLAAIGTRHLQLVDFDYVEPTNITTQGYFTDDLGQLKVDATATHLRRIEPDLNLNLVPDRYRSDLSVGEVVFCCVDSITARAAIWRSVQHRCRFYADARMRGETLRLLTATDPVSQQHYATTLFPQSEAQPGPCTAKGTIYAATIAAGMLVHQFTRWLRNVPIDPDLSLNLLAGELVANTCGV